MGRWLEAYAPERARIEIRRDALPVEVDQLRPEQRGYLRALSEAAHGDAPATGEQWQAAIFAVAADHGLDAKAAFIALYLAFLGRPERAACGLAAGEPRARLRDPPAQGGRRARGGDGMSVGVQRLREDPDRIRQGAIDKGEDPAVVDRAIEVDATRRRLQAESDTLKSERNTASKQIGEAIRGGAKPDGPEVAELRAASTRCRRADRGHRRRAGGRRGRARRPAAADPEPRRPRRPGRRRGGERHRPHLG